MRYTLAGGHQANSENIVGLSYCFQESERFAKITSLKSEIHDAMASLMGSPGHRQTILNATYTKVNIGLAWNSYTINAVQHFEGDYVTYLQEPQITDNILAFSGTTRNGVSFHDEDSLFVHIYYHPPPRPFTAGQVFRTECYDDGLEVTALRPPLPAGWFYDEDTYTGLESLCISPHNISADAAAPSSYWEALEPQERLTPPTRISWNWTTADKWTVNDTDFAISADLTDTLTEHGPGVYTITLWAEHRGEDLEISNFAIFHDIPRPTLYDDPVNQPTQ